MLLNTNRLASRVAMQHASPRRTHVKTLEGILSYWIEEYALHPRGLTNHIPNKDWESADWHWWLGRVYEQPFSSVLFVWLYRLGPSPSKLIAPHLVSRPEIENAAWSDVRLIFTMPTGFPLFISLLFCFLFWLGLNLPIEKSISPWTLSRGSRPT